MACGFRAQFSGPRWRQKLCRFGALHWCLLVAGTCGFGSAQALVVQLQVSNDTVPPGTTAQIKISSAKPVLVAAGRIVIDFDPTVFDNIAAAQVFSAAGDAYGAATLQGHHLDVTFASASAGIGQLPELPILQVSIPVLAAAKPGATSVIQIDASQSPWTDAQGHTYSVSANSGTLTVGGTLSISGVSPGGGVQPQGTVVQITGTGFSSATSVQVQGVAIDSIQFVSPQKMNFTLAAPTEMTGHNVVLENPDGSHVDFFPWLQGVANQPSAAGLAQIQPIFPLQAELNSSVGSSAFNGIALALQNQNAFPVDVTLYAFGHVDSLAGANTVTIPAGGIYLEDTAIAVPTAFTEYVNVIPSAPIRMLGIDYPPFTSVAIATLLPPGPAEPSALIGATPPISFLVQPGSAAPPSQSFVVFANRLSLDFKASVATGSGGSWLSLDHLQGIACLSIPTPNCDPSSLLKVSVNSSALSAGTYSGTITLTATDPTVLPAVVNVTLVSNAVPVIAVDPPGYAFAPPDLPPLHVSSNGTSAAFTVTAATDFGGNWLSVKPAKGTTPATLTVSMDTTGLKDFLYTGNITITGPGNTLIVPVALYMQGGLPEIGFDQTGLVHFSSQVGAAAPPPSILTGGVNLDGATVVVSTADGGHWLSASLAPPNLSISVNPVGLAPGDYTGAVTFVSTTAYSPPIPVGLMVYKAPAPSLSVNPTSLVFDSSCPYCDQTLTLTTGDIALDFSASVSTVDGNDWLQVYVPPSFQTTAGVTPATVIVSANSQSVPQGTWHGDVTITSSVGTVVVPYTMTNITGLGAGLYQPPVIGSIVSGASEVPSAVSPGEILTLHGADFGPPVPAGLTLDASGKVNTTVDGVLVLFDGKPAPLLYASATQINTIVPYEVTGNVTQIEVQNNGGPTIAWGVPVAPSAPGIFTGDSTGIGQAAVLNQDGSVNSASNPAARGSVIQIFATGEGVTVPAGVTGSITGTEVRIPVLPVDVTIGGLDAQLTFKGSAPHSVAGLFQVNAVVPTNVTPGPAVPIVLKIGAAQSQNSVTIAVQ